jgi:hypothetical protein
MLLACGGGGCAYHPAVAVRRPGGEGAREVVVVNGTALGELREVECGQDAAKARVVVQGQLDQAGQTRKSVRYRACEGI